MSEILTRYIAKPKLKEILNQEKYRKKYRNQKEFALAVGVKDPTISRFDTQSRYDINTLISVSKELEIPVEDLFEIEENPNYIKIEFPKYDTVDMEIITQFANALLESKIISRDNDTQRVRFNEDMPKEIIDAVEDSVRELMTKYNLTNQIKHNKVE